MATAELNHAIAAPPLETTKKTMFADRGTKFSHVLFIDGIDSPITPGVVDDLIKRHILEFHLLDSLLSFSRREIAVSAPASSVIVSAFMTCLAPSASPSRRN